MTWCWDIRQPRRFPLINPLVKRPLKVYSSLTGSCYTRYQEKFCQSNYFRHFNNAGCRLVTAEIFFYFITSRWQCATLNLNKSAYWGSSREDLDEQNRSQAWAVGFSLLLFLLCDLLLHVCVYHCSRSFLCRSPFCWQLINNAGTTPVSVWSGSVPAPVGPGRGGSLTPLPVLSLNSPEMRKVTSYFQGTIESQLRRTTLFDLKHSPTLRFRCTDVFFFVQHTFCLCCVCYKRGSRVVPRRTAVRYLFALWELSQGEIQTQRLEVLFAISRADGILSA